MRRRDVYIMIAIIAIALGSVVAVSQDELSWGGVLARIFNSSNESLQVSIVSQAGGLDVSEETALTNTVNNIVTLTHTTTGTPAANIGAGIDYIQETSASNNETIMKLDAVVDDATAASEDASFSVKLMAAGAAAAEKFAVESTGVVTLVGGTTLDNVTAATELNITETNIQLTGALDLEGGNVKINEDSGDYDFAIETDSTDNAFSIDSGNSTLETNGVTVTLNQGSADVDFIVESDGVADALKVDAGRNAVDLGAFFTYEIATSSAQSYSIASAGKASVHIQTAGAAATAHLMTDLLTSPGAGGVIILKTGDASDIVVDTEGAETINGAATYTIDGTQEAVTFITDGTNWHILGSYLE